MTKKRKTIQLMLTFVGVFLILITYILYPKIGEKKVSERKSVIIESENDKEISDAKNKDNTFENVEYKGLYDFDKPFTVKSDKAYILSDEEDIVYMTRMEVTLSMKDGRVIVITSEKGSYNKKTYDCFFQENVKATDGKTIITSKNLDLIASEDFASVYNDVVIKNDGSHLKADKVDYNFVSKKYNFSMFENAKKVKVKIIN
tara:strand:- start:826 stop:1431 length:606 start_codon:yes stop_codon:yes gene_type:complete